MPQNLVLEELKFNSNNEGNVSKINTEMSEREQEPIEIDEKE